MVQTNSLKRKLFIITGPTAIGKSNYAVELATINKCEIISADSMQVYKKLNIGTGKILPYETKGIKHHLIDIVEPYECYSVGQFVDDAKNIIDKLSKTPIIVGGTGLYISSLLNGNNFGNAQKNLEIRNKWNKILEDKGKQYVYDYLKKIDSVSADKISIEDTKRVIRAIEIYEITGTPKSNIVCENKQQFDAKVVILYNENREELYNSINNRVEKMFNNGLVDEVKSLSAFKNCQSMQAIGYKEVIAYLENKITLTEAVELVKKNSRNYAKRQMTYFRNMNVENKIYVRYDNFNELCKIFNEL